MTQYNDSMNRNVLIIGDAIALGAVTLLGFGSHGEFSSAFLPRMAAAFVPLCTGWFVLAPWFGMFDEATMGKPVQSWLPAFIMLFAGPFAVIVRGLLLQAPVMPIFGVVLSVTGAVALTAWRGAYLLLARRGRATR